MKYSIPPYRQISHIVETEVSALEFLVNRGIIQRDALCIKCGQSTTLRLDKKTRRCKETMCRYEQSCIARTFFAKHKSPVNIILESAYFWLAKATNKQIETFTNLSNPTVTSLINYFREMIADSLDEIDLVIGGENVIVEIDETKLGKRKYQRGHRVDGVWVLVGVERTAERKVFLRILPDRSAHTLEEMILRHTAPGSIIMTDCWRGYNSLEQLGYSHLTVNHSRTFRDVETGACTNTVEGTNNAIKMSIHPRNRTSECEDSLWQFIWRRKHDSNLWEGFLGTLSEVSYDE